jgi:hypothetical protein
MTSATKYSNHDVAIGIYRPPDVRPILQAYAGKVIPVEYAKAEAEAKQKHIEEWNATKGIAGGGLSISRLFGGRSGVSFIHHDKPEVLRNGLIMKTSGRTRGHSIDILGTEA